MATQPGQITFLHPSGDAHDDETWHFDWGGVIEDKAAWTQQAKGWCTNVGTYRFPD